MDPDARFNFFFQRQPGQFIGADGGAESGQCLAYQQGFLLPVVAQKKGGVDTLREMDHGLFCS